MRPDESPVMFGIFTTMVDAAIPHALPLVPAAPQNELGETSARIMVAKTSGNTVHWPVHSVACKIGVAIPCNRCAGELAVCWAPSGDHGSGAIS